MDVDRWEFHALAVLAPLEIPGAVATGDDASHGDRAADRVALQ
jgi:hypothetical protein